MKEQLDSPSDLREQAVQVLYDSFKKKHSITKEECYEIYDKMQKENAKGSQGSS